MARQRFVAPHRGDIGQQSFEAPIFDGFRRWNDWLVGSDWPSIEALNAQLGTQVHPHSGQPLRFVRQDAALLADGLHYEQRIFERGGIATRAENWHDLFNALVWLRDLSIKAALNARQAADVARQGPAERTRAQCALTHFDEGGAIVVLRDLALLALWDAHDWSALFWREREAWTDGRAEVIVIGHALLEHALSPAPMHTAKCLAVSEPSRSRQRDDDAARSALAAAIANGDALEDPQELRPLPLSGIPGWHRDNGEHDFYVQAPCFRPLRPGRIYPPPLRLD